MCDLEILESRGDDAMFGLESQLIGHHRRVAFEKVPEDLIQVLSKVVGELMGCNQDREGCSRCP